MKIALLFPALLLGAGSLAAAETAPSILDKMGQAYLAVKSYQDEGVVLMPDPAKPSPDEITFRLYFTRPNLLRFEWTSHHPYPPLRHLVTYSMVWSDGKEVFTFRQRPDRNGVPGEATLKQEDKLSLGIAGATGVSMGSAHDIPVLLLPELGGFRLTELAGAALMGEEDFEGVMCYHLRGTFSQGGHAIEVWIGTKDYLLRRIMTDLGRGRPPHEEIHREIRVNHEIPKDTFSPKPTEKKQP